MVGVKERSRLHVPAQGIRFGARVLHERPKPPWRGVKDLARRLRDDEDGTFGTSGLYVANWIDIVDATQLAVNLTLTSAKIALYTNTLTPNFSTDVSYAATNEATGTGYTATGQVITSPTITESPTGSLMFDMADQVWASPTTVTARGGIYYQDALAADNLIFAVTFGADIASTAGTFTIQWASTGCFVLDLTP